MERMSKIVNSGCVQVIENDKKLSILGVQVEETKQSR